MASNKINKSEDDKTKKTDDDQTKNQLDEKTCFEIIKILTVTNNDLNEQIKKLESSNMELKQQNKDTTDQISRLKEQIVELTLDINVQTVANEYEVSQLKDKCKTLDIKVIEQDIHIENLNIKNKNLQTEADKLKLDIQQNHNSYEGANKLKSECIESVQKLSEEVVHKNKRLIKKLRQLKVEKDKLQSKLEASKIEISNLKETIKNKDWEINAEEQKINKLENENKSLLEELNWLKLSYIRDIDAMKKKMNDSNERVKEIESIINDFSIFNMQAEITKLKEAKMLLQITIQGLKQRNSKFEFEIKELEIENKKLKKDLDYAANDIESLKNEVKRLITTDSVIKEINNLNGSNKDKVGNTLDEISKMKSVIDKYKDFNYNGIHFNVIKLLRTNNELDRENSRLRKLLVK